MSTYARIQSGSDLRLPLEGSIDLTYRCNNACRHCWVRLGADAPEERDELSFDEIRRIADEARAMGTRSWSISGGEPMLRPDFADIFEYLTAKAKTYSLNTNGTLITPAIAQLLKRKGSKMVALYGATAETYDRVAMHPGGFELAMQGFRYLREAGAGFIVQLIPMRENWHEWEQMQTLANSLSEHVRVGAAWLYKTACGSAARNGEIDRQRLDPAMVIELDQPIPRDENDNEISSEKPMGDDSLFTGCIADRSSFHINPYGQMSFCSYIQDPSLRYDLRKGTFQEGWEVFLPSLVGKVRGGKEYLENCAVCDLRADCKWCPAYGHLEHGRFSAPVEYLCAIAREARQFKQDWVQRNRRYYKIAEITLQVESDLPFAEDSFSPAVEKFRVEKPGDDVVTIRHHFELPDLKGKDLGEQVYRKPPWAIYKGKAQWIYLSIPPDEERDEFYKVAVFNRDYSHGRVYHQDCDGFLRGGGNAITQMVTDQILLAQLLAQRKGFILHSAGAILNGSGVLFVGHSEAGKTTITRLLMQSGEDVEILCDDRNIVRRFEGSWRVFGSWSHGDIDNVSAESAPLEAIFFLEQASEDQLLFISDTVERVKRLLACLIRPYASVDWWEKSLSSVEKLVGEVPCYRMQFTKNGEVVTRLERLIGGNALDLSKNKC